MEKSRGGGGGTALINLSFCSTNMLCSDWGQSDRRTKSTPPAHIPHTPCPPPSPAQNIHFYHVAGLSFFFPPGSWEKRSALEGLQTAALKPFFTCTISRLPRRSFNCNIFQMARMLLSFVARKPVIVSHSTPGATQTGKKQHGKRFL